ncbi:Imm32 family immunity protein [Streptomyces sp. NPDC002758]
MTTHVSTVTEGITRVFTWEEGARIEVRNLGGEIVVEANAAGLKTLARHLLTLAQDGTPDGTHLHLGHPKERGRPAHPQPFGMRAVPGHGSRTHSCALIRNGL